MMTTREPVRAVILALLAAVLFATSADAQRIGSTYVFDGDTVAIGGTRARIWGIDAPDQPLGRHLKLCTLNNDFPDIM